MKNPELKAFLDEQVKILVESSHTCKELMAVCKDWQAAEGTDKEAEALKALVAEAEVDVMDLDHAIAIVSSEGGKRHFGEAVAKKLYDEAMIRKNRGEVWCFCDACVAAKKIADKKAELLA
jgi:hypothetical protein